MNCLPTERCRPGIGAYAHAVLRYALQADRTRSSECSHVVGQQFIHQSLVAGTEVIERVVVHRDAAAAPSTGIVRLAQPRHFTPAAHAFERCLQPQREQAVRIDRRPTGNAAASLVRQNLSKLFDAVKARGSVAGRAAIDPHILFALWLYATLEGVGSGREVARLRA